MNVKLPNSVASPQDLAALIYELQQYSKWFTHESIKQEVTGGQTITPTTVSSAVAEVVGTWHDKKPPTLESITELIKELETHAKVAQTMTLTLAAPAPNSLKTTLVAWCRQQLTPNILINFRFNANLLGGMVVDYNSKVYDWSFRREILAGRQKFAEILRNV